MFSVVSPLLAVLKKWLSLFGLNRALLSALLSPLVAGKTTSTAAATKASRTGFQLGRV